VASWQWLKGLVPGRLSARRRRIRRRRKRSYAHLRGLGQLDRPQGIRNVRETIERTDHGGEIAQKHGLKLEQAYWTVGPYDMVTVFEAPDEEALSAHLLEIGSLGNVRPTTLRAYGEEEMSGILQRLG
jgi:uncharacterized protein with GYD domain